METQKLREWGLSPEQIERVMEENGRELGEAEQRLAGLERMRERIVQLEAQAEQSRQQLEQADGLRQRSQQAEEEWKQRWRQRDFEEALGQALHRSGARSERAVRALLDEEALRPGEDGAPERIREAIDRLQVQHSYLFSAQKAPPQILRPGSHIGPDAEDCRIREIMGLPGPGQRKDDF
ncbi:MAG: hypothetical protein HFK04_01110 [Oscillospiraceae bacterium]|nr:hypothetical protein [Oscillospiraceae bacterium]